jgi:small subunit ribosomal protein S2
MTGKSLKLYSRMNIAANLYSIRAVQLICGVLGRAGESGQKKRLEAAKTGKVTWSTNREFQEWASDDEPFAKAYKEAAKAKQTAKAMGIETEPKR